MASPVQAESAERLADRESAVREAKAGCDEAFGRLYADLAPRVRRVALRRTRDRHEAEDAVQDAFLCAYRCIGRLEDPRLFENWIVRIACNRAIDRARRLARCRPSERASDDELDRAPDMPRVVLRTGGSEPPPDRAALVSGTLEEMSPTLRRALCLRYERGMSCDEIARREGVTVTAVKTRLHRARQLLRAALIDAPQRRRRPGAARPQSSRENVTCDTPGLELPASIEP